MDADRDGYGWGALADSTRRAIVACLAERPQAVGELAAGLPVSRSAVSQHLKVLNDAGLVSDGPIRAAVDVTVTPGGVCAYVLKPDTLRGPGPPCAGRASAGRSRRDG